MVRMMIIFSHVIIENGYYFKSIDYLNFRQARKIYHCEYLYGCNFTTFYFIARIHIVSG